MPVLFKFYSNILFVVLHTYLGIMGALYVLYMSKDLKLNKSYLNIVKPKAIRENWMLTKPLLISKVNEDNLQKQKGALTVKFLLI